MKKKKMGVNATVGGVVQKPDGFRKSYPPGMGLGHDYCSDDQRYAWGTKKPRSDDRGCVIV